MRTRNLCTAKARLEANQDIEPRAREDDDARLAGPKLPERERAMKGSTRLSLSMMEGLKPQKVRVLEVQSRVFTVLCLPAILLPLYLRNLFAFHITLVGLEDVYLGNIYGVCYR